MSAPLPHVAVLMGGWSAEREISLISGRDCARALEGEGFPVTQVDADRHVAGVLAELRPDVAFNALHGPWGEDGCVQGLLEVMAIPYTHSGVLASALAMDKARAKDMFGAAGLAVAESVVLPRAEAAARHAMAPPYVVKPVNQGSSVGVHMARAGDNRPPPALGGDDWRFGEQIMVERFVSGLELTCAVMDGRALGVTHIVAAGEFYDYNSKYCPGGSRHVLPASVPPAVGEEAQRIALAAHDALGCRGISRADLILEKTDNGADRLILLEVNTQPGMTPTSLVPEQAAHAGIAYGALVRWMVEDASCGR